MCNMWCCDVVKNGAWCGMLCNDQHVWCGVMCHIFRMWNCAWCGMWCDARCGVQWNVQCGMWCNVTLELCAAVKWCMMWNVMWWATCEVLWCVFVIWNGACGGMWNEMWNVLQCYCTMLCHITPPRGCDMEWCMMWCGAMWNDMGCVTVLSQQHNSTSNCTTFHHISSCNM